MTRRKTTPQTERELTPPDPLTPKQRLFVEAYLSNGFNGVRAAMAAGYAGAYGTLGKMAYDNLRKPEIAAVVQERLKQQQMTSGEVLARLSGMARADLGEFVGLSGDDILKHPSAWLIKRFRRRVTTSASGETIETVEITLHDAMQALALMLRVHGLFAPGGLPQDSDTPPAPPEEYDSLTEEELIKIINDVRMLTDGKR